MPPDVVTVTGDALVPFAFQTPTIVPGVAVGRVIVNPAMDAWTSWPFFAVVFVVALTGTSCSSGVHADVAAE
jgi:hypothetical protein